MTRCLLPLVVPAVLAVAACTPTSVPLDPHSVMPEPRPTQAATAPFSTPQGTAGTFRSNSSATPSRGLDNAVTAAPEESVDPRWRFFTSDETRYASPWYDGRHRVMIGFGCTEAPYYRSDPRCPGRQGFHHGIDVAIPCGATLRSPIAGRVVLGGLGPAYGNKAFRIRTGDHDVLIGHVQRVLVGDGEILTPGRPIGEVGALGAPDGCHLHLEQRSVGGGLSSATDPTAALALRS